MKLPRLQIYGHVGTHIKLCSDGGFAGRRGSAAYVAFDFSGPSHCDFARGGAYLPMCRSAFEAEVIALDLAIQDLLSNISVDA